MGSFRGRMQHWGRLALANPIAFVATFTLGAFMAFAYSYVPLHTVKDRKVVRLESTVLEQEEAIAGLEDQLEALRVAAAETPDDAIASLQSDRDEVKREIANVRAALDKAKKRSKSLERERNDWKRKVAALEKELAELPTMRLAQEPAEPATTPVPVSGAGAARAGGVAEGGLRPPTEDPGRAEPMPAAPAP